MRMNNKFRLAEMAARMRYSMKNVLEVYNLVKAYEGITAVDNLSMEWHELRSAMTPMFSALTGPRHKSC